MTRVHELAKEFGVESKFILEKFKEMGEFVKSASSTVSAAAEMRFKKEYGEQLRSAAGRPTQAASSPPASAGSFPANQRRYGTRRDRSRSDRTPPSTHLLDASRIFGVPVDELKPAREERPRGRYASSESRRRPTAWDENWIDDEERRSWIAAGLGPDDGRIAGQLKDNGLTADDLMLRVDGVRASERLRGGESVGSVAARLREFKRNRDVG